MVSGPFDEVTKINEVERGDSIIYTLRVKALMMSTAKTKARMWARVNNPFSTSAVTVIQVLDPITGGVLSGGHDFSINIEDIPEEEKPDVSGIGMRDTFDVQVGVRR